MRFVTFRGQDGRPVAGVMLTADRVLDLSDPACAALLDGTPPSVDAFVEQGLDAWAQRLSDAPPPQEAVRPLADLTLLAPLRPAKVIGAAFNFTDALAERGLSAPAAPVLFMRAASTVIGPGEAIQVPPDVGHVGYEAELAVVIGRRALRVSRNAAMHHVAGYVAHNDVSGSSLVKEDGGNFVRGKNLRASAPLGPWLATPDELPNPHAVRIRLDIDGRPLQNGTTANLVFDIPALIEAASHWVPLEPGDVIATGTPAGVAGMHRPEAWLRPGITVTVEVEGLGRLVNPVVEGENFHE